MSNTYELRTYQIAEGRMGDAIARFENHTDSIFRDYGIESLGYWISQEDPNRLIYIVRHTGDPEANWEGFRADERWIKARDESHENGVIALDIKAERLDPIAMSALQ